jgi:PAS domain S-box-containing protein
MAFHPGQQKRHFPEEVPVVGDPIRRALEENEDWYRDLVEHSRDLLCVHDLEGRFLSINPTPARLLGYSVEEMLQKPMRDFIDPQFRAQFDAYLREIARAGQADGRLALLTRSGEQRIWEYHNTLRTEGVETPIVRRIAHDVTERVRAEKALRAANEMLLRTAREQEIALQGLTLFRTLLDQSNDAILVTDPETLRFLDSNERAWTELGYSREELLSMTVVDIDPDIVSVRTQVDQQLRQTGCAIIERAHRRKNGTTFPVELNLRRVRLDRQYDVAVSRDITERKRAEEALRLSEERFRVALKHSPIAVFNQDRDLRYTWIYNSQLPFSDSEKLDKTMGEILDPEEAARIMEVRRRVLETGVGVRQETQVTYGGRKYYFDATIEPVLDSAGAVIGLTGASTNVTELREANEELREAKRKLTEEKLYLEQEIDAELGLGEIIGQSKVLQAVMEQVGKVAASDATVLLLGETGTGKELVARAIHQQSQRADNSFIKMNCAAIPSGLLESELFGNEKGAFTGAVNRKIGRLELADKGTLFLDEIGEISLALQPKLLRVLQDREFERLGGIHTLKVDFRLIAATNRDLAEDVREHEFRSDLYYRLNVFPIRVPTLRERREDIPLLVEHFVQKFSRRMNRTITSIPKRIMDALMGWEWPGNVRELENFIERSVILTQGSVLVAPLSELKPMTATQKEVVDESLGAAEREHIRRALRESHGQIGGPRGAATRLGLKRTTLQSKLKQLGINPRATPPGH